QQCRSLVLHRVLLSDVYMSESVGLFLSNVNRSDEQVSAQNRTVHCRHFGICGGCSVPGVPYAEQLRRKRGRLAALLRLHVPPLVPSPREDAFRQKAAFAFGSAPRGGLVMGHYAAGSTRIVPIDECPVHSARANRIAFALRDRLAAAGVTAAGARGG